MRASICARAYAVCVRVRARAHVCVCVCVSFKRKHWTVNKIKQTHLILLDKHAVMHKGDADLSHRA